MEESCQLLTTYLKNAPLRLVKVGAQTQDSAKPVALVEGAAALVGLVVAVVQPVAGAVQPQVVGALPVALAIVDFVRPGIGGQRLEPVGEALVQLDREAVVVAVDAVLGVRHRAVTGVRTLAGVDRRGLGSRRVAACVGDGVGEIGGGGREVEVADAVQLKTAAPDVGDVRARSEINCRWMPMLPCSE